MASVLELPSRSDCHRSPALGKGRVVSAALGVVSIRCASSLARRSASSGGNSSSLVGGAYRHGTMRSAIGRNCKPTPSVLQGVVLAGGPEPRRSLRGGRRGLGSTERTYSAWQAQSTALNLIALLLWTTLPILPQSSSRWYLSAGLSSSLYSYDPALSKG